MFDLWMANIKFLILQNRKIRFKRILAINLSIGLS